MISNQISCFINCDNLSWCVQTVKKQHPLFYQFLVNLIEFLGRIFFPKKNESLPTIPHISEVKPIAFIPKNQDDIMKKCQMMNMMNGVCSIIYSSFNDVETIQDKAELEKICSCKMLEIVKIINPAASERIWAANNKPKEEILSIIINETIQSFNAFLSSPYLEQSDKNLIIKYMNLLGIAPEQIK